MAALASSCLDASRRTPRPLISAPASPARLSPDTNIAMPSKSHGGVRTGRAVRERGMDEPCATIVRRSFVEPPPVRAPHDEYALAPELVDPLRLALDRVLGLGDGDQRPAASACPSSAPWCRLPLRATMTSTFRGAFHPGQPRDHLPALPFSRSVIRLPTLRLVRREREEVLAACGPCSACTPTARASPPTAGRWEIRQPSGVLSARHPRGLVVGRVDACRACRAISTRKVARSPSSRVPSACQLPRCRSAAPWRPRSRACPWRPANPSSCPGSPGSPRTRAPGRGSTSSSSSCIGVARRASSAGFGLLSATTSSRGAGALLAECRRRRRSASPRRSTWSSGGWRPMRAQ